MDSKVKEALELFKQAESGWSRVYNEGRDDLTFYSGDQWNPNDITGRTSLKRPVITLNKLPQFVHQVVNDIRQNVPSMKALPMDDGADIETAKIVQGLLKNIEYVSRSHLALNMAAENQVKGSIGFIRVDHDYVAPDKFEQHCLIKAVPNPLAVLLDPNSVEMDGSDARFAFITEPIDMRTYEEMYPDATKTDFSSSTPTKLNKEKESVTIAEFYRLKEETADIALLENGSTVMLEKAIQLGMPVKSTRKIKKNIVIRCKMNGDMILEETRFPGSFIPIVPVYGEVHWADGQRNIFSLIRFAKDAQRMHNYWASLETEVISKAPQAPFMAAEGQIEGYESEWSNPAMAQVLPYRSKDVDGNLVGPPQRLNPPTIPTGIVNARATTAQDMKEIMGIYNASLGERSNERTGVAIQARQREGDTGTMHFADNLNRSYEHVGRILLSMFPEIYDTPRAIRVIGSDDSQKIVGINGYMVDGQERPFDINAGKYDVAITTGPSQTTRRQEIQLMMSNVMQTNPQLVQVMGDLFFKYSDMPGADVIAERLKKTIPPQLLEGENDADEKIPAQAQAALEQMQMQIEQSAAVIEASKAELLKMSQELEACKAELQSNQAEIALKAKSDTLKAETDRMKLALDAKKLELEQQKLEIEAFKAHTEAMNMQAQPEMPKEIGLKVDSTGFQIMKTPEQEAAEQVEKETEAQKEQLEMQQKQQELQLMQADIESRRQEAQALIESLGSIKDGLGALIASVNKPKTVVRDELGLIKSVE
jgi:hypothetical protein